MKNQQIFHHDDEFLLEAGGVLPGFQLEYTTLGRINQERSNVVWVMHALTGNSDVTTWWPGLFESGGPFDPVNHFVICVNTLGGCYGSTGPLSLNPSSGNPFYHEFPMLTNRDIVRAFDLLRIALGIGRVHTVIGSSLGGQQALEWTLMREDIFDHLILIATNAQHSPWGIAFNEAQRMAIEADTTWKDNDPKAGTAGMRAARAMAMLSYRSAEGFRERQLDASPEKLEDYRAASYLRYQGQKLAGRFNAFTYWNLTKAMDSHHVGRGRGTVEDVLNKVKAKTLVVGIETDLLFPLAEQQLLAKCIPGARLEQIQSLYGHDGFLVEFDQLRTIIRKFYEPTETQILV